MTTKLEILEELRKVNAEFISKPYDPHKVGSYRIRVARILKRVDQLERLIESHLYG